MMKLTCVLLVILIAESLSADYDPKCVDESGNPISTNGFQIEGECETFQQCSNGILVTKSCGEGLAFDPLTGICNYPSQVSGCEYMDGVDPSLAGYCRDEDGNVLNPPPSPTRKPGTCDTYYECSNGGLIERTCAPPLVFNPDFGACDWEASSPYCEPGTTPPPPDTTTTQPTTTTSTTTTPTTTTPTTTTTTTTPTTTTTTTTTPTTTTTTTATSTTTTTTTTPPTTTTTTTTTTTPSSTDGTTTRNSPPVTKPTSTEGGISTTPGPTESELCYDEDGNPITSSVPFGKEGECKTYYVCSHGFLYTKQCGDDLAFDPSISMCNHALSVPGCEEFGGADPDLAGYCIDDEGNTLVPPPPPVLKAGTCNTFYSCEGSKLVETECAPGLIFNPEVGNCDYTYNSPNCTVPTTQASTESAVTEPAATDSDDEVKTTEQTMPVVGTSEASPHSSTTPKVPAPDATAPITSGTDDPFPYESTTKVIKPSTTSPDPHPPTEPDSPTTTRHAVPPEISTTAAAEGGEVTTKGDSIKPEATEPDVKPSSPADITTSQPASSGPGDSGPDESTSQRPAVPATTGPDSQPPSPVPTTVGHGPPRETTIEAADTTAPEVQNSTRPRPITDAVSTTTSTTDRSTSTTTTSAPEALSYIGFVVDDTGSMSYEIEGVKQWMTNCVKGIYTDCKNLPTGGWLMTSFNDPVYYNGPVIGPTTNAQDVIDAIEGLYAHGGGDCPEYAMTGLESAIDAIPDDAGSCKMFFWTDALPKDWPIASTVYEKYIKKGCTFIPILTGCCGYCVLPCDPDNPVPESCDYSVVDGRKTAKRRRRRSTSASDETVYYNLALDTGGTIFITDKPSSPEDMLDFLEEEVTLGFCPTSEVAGPPPGGYDKHDCNITKQCWDQSESTCYCTSETEPCPKDPIPTAPTVPECAQDEPHAYFADPNNCTLFYQCASGTMWHMPCPTGLVFDPSISVCNWPSSMAPPCGTCSVCIEE